MVDELLLARIAAFPEVTCALARLAALRGRFLGALAVTRRLRRVGATGHPQMVPRFAGARRPGRRRPR